MISTSATELTAVGLKIHLLTGARSQPVPPPAQFVYRNSATGKTTGRFDPEALWWHDQHIVRWLDGSGNSMSLAEIAIPLPTGFPQRHVTRKEYEAAARKLSGIRWNTSTISRWVEEYTGAKPVSQPTSVDVRGTELSEAVEYHLGGTQLVYAVHVPFNSYWQADGKWFLCHFKLKDGTDLQHAKKSIVAKILKRIAPVRRGPPRKSSHSTRLQEKALAPSPREPALLAEGRHLVSESLENMPDWWHVDTTHYVLVSNLAESNRKTVTTLQRDLEYLHHAYSKIMPPLAKIMSVKIVRLFSSERQYIEYVGKDMAWSAGVWMPGINELALRPLGAVSGRATKLLSVMYHEAFHQYLSYAYPNIETSVWFNEGHAEFFENTSIIRNYPVVGPSLTHVGRLATMINENDMDVGSMLKMSYAEFYAGTNEARRKRNYALAWGIVYYLRKGADKDAGGAYTGILDKYCRELGRTRNGGRATAAAFSGVDLNRFRQDLTAFWKSTARQDAAKRNHIFK